MVEVLIGTLDLLKAEGRALREIIILVAIALTLVAAAAMVVIGGVIFLIFAVFFALRPEYGLGGASLITGLICLIFSGVTLWLIWWSMNRRRRIGSGGR